jgi:hypothetical protein
MIVLGPVADRLRGSPRLQRILARVVACGDRPVGELLVELLEASNADSAVLDRLEDGHRLDPETARSLGGRDFLRPPLRVVPRQERGR